MGEEEEDDDEEEEEEDDDDNNNKKNNNDTTNNNNKQPTGLSKDDAWEDKVKLWKKLLKGIEMDMIIASEKKACNKTIHLKFMKELNIHMNNFTKNLLTDFYFSNDEDVHKEFSFINKNETNK